jgi:hypothetical protein
MAYLCAQRLFKKKPLSASAGMPDLPEEPLFFKQLLNFLPLLTLPASLIFSNLPA